MEKQRQKKKKKRKTSIKLLLKVSHKKTFGVSQTFFLEKAKSFEPTKIVPLYRKKRLKKSHQINKLDHTEKFRIRVISYLLKKKFAYTSLYAFICLKFLKFVLKKKTKSVLKSRNFFTLKASKIKKLILSRAIKNYGFYRSPLKRLVKSIFRRYIMKNCGNYNFSEKKLKKKRKLHKVLPKFFSHLKSKFLRNKSMSRKKKIQKVNFLLNTISFLKKKATKKVDFYMYLRNIFATGPANFLKKNTFKDCFDKLDKYKEEKKFHENSEVSINLTKNIITDDDKKNRDLSVNEYKFPQTFSNSFSGIIFEKDSSKYFYNQYIKKLKKYTKGLEKLFKLRNFEKKFTVLLRYFSKGKYFKRQQGAKIVLEFITVVVSLFNNLQNNYTVNRYALDMLAKYGLLLEFMIFSEFHARYLSNKLWNFQYNSCLENSKLFFKDSALLKALQISRNSMLNSPLHFYYYLKKIRIKKKWHNCALKHFIKMKRIKRMKRIRYKETIEEREERAKKPRAARATKRFIREKYRSICSYFIEKRIQRNNNLITAEIRRSVRNRQKRRMLFLKKKISFDFLNLSKSKKNRCMEKPIKYINMKLLKLLKKNKRPMFPYSPPRKHRLTDKDFSAIKKRHGAIYLSMYKKNYKFFFSKAKGKKLKISYKKKISKKKKK